MVEYQDEVANLLSALQLELQVLAVWELNPPSDKALQSTQPFAVDMLELHQWLQWIFLPRMQVLLDGEHVLPECCGIQPMLHDWARRMDKPVVRLNRILLALDEILSQ